MLGGLLRECSADELGFDRDDRVLLRNHGDCPPVLGALFSGMPQRRLSNAPIRAFRLRLSAYLHSMLGGAAVQPLLATGAGVDDESHHSFCAFPLCQSKR